MMPEILKKYWYGCVFGLIPSALLLFVLVAAMAFPGLGGGEYFPETKAAEIVQAGPAFSGGDFRGTRLSAGQPLRADTRPMEAGAPDGASRNEYLLLEPGTPRGEYVSEPQHTDFPFNAVSVHWASDEPEGSAVEVEVRFSEDGSQWGEWQPVEHDELEAPDFAAEKARESGEKFGLIVFVEKGQYLQYRLQVASNAGGATPAVSRVTATYIDSKGYHQGSLSLTKFVGQVSAFISPARADADPGVITRAQWGANESWMTWTPEYSTPRKQIIHHTVTANNDPDPAATVRAIYYDHAVIKQWGDIGYNYLIDAQGRVYEGRYGGNGVIGGHALNWNTGTIGISALGNYETAGISTAMYNSFVDLLAAKSNQNEIDPRGYSVMNNSNTPNYIGHKDTYATACPGAHLYPHLPSFREEAFARYSTQPIGGAILAKWQSLNGSPGAARNAEYPVYSGASEWLGQAQDFAVGRLVWDPGNSGVYWVYGGILEKYDQLGKQTGFLGMPRSDEYGIAGGRANNFAGGHIYWSPATGAKSVRGGILDKLLSDGGVARDGFPLTDEYDVDGYPGARESDFERARIYWSYDGGSKTVFGGIMGRYLQLGGPQAYGLPVSDEYDIPGVSGGRESDFASGRVYWSPSTGANGVTGGILNKYLALGGTASSYGLPLDNGYVASNGRAQTFQTAVITWDMDSEAHITYGGILGKYRQMGGPTGNMGLATIDEADVPDIGGARHNVFQSGRIYWHASTGAHAVLGAINHVYGSLGGPSLLGIPLSDEYDVPGIPGGRESDFQRGRIYYHPGLGTHAVYGSIFAKYSALGGPAGVLGMPAAAEADVSGVPGARESRFQRGRIYWSPATGSQAVYGGILGKYLEFGGPTSILGMPISDEYDYGSGRRNDFQGGYIYWTPGAGAMIYTGTATTITSNTAYEVRDGGGALLAAPAAGQTTSVSYVNGAYSVQAPGVSRTTGSYIRVTASGGIVQVTSYHDIPSWNPNLDDNRFRGAVEVRYSAASGALWVVNELPLEDYLKGIAESSSGLPPDFLKTMSIAARGYALWHLERGGKHGASEIFHLKNSRNGNGDDQQYKGYGLEARFADLTAAVNATAGQVVTYQGQLALTPYFSNTDGRTRSAQEAWGVDYWPWLQSVPDPDCNGMTLNGHGVGLSGTGALAAANRGSTYQAILAYYYTGTSLQTLNTSGNIRIAIARVS